MNKIVLNDGTEIENVKMYKATWADKLICEIPGNDVVSSVMLFSDPKKTQKITYYHDNVFENIFENYTELNSVIYVQDGDFVKISLTGVNTSVKNGYTLPDEYVPGALAEEIFSNQREEQQDNEQ